MNWVCDIPGGDTTTASWHLVLHLGLAIFVIVAGVVFLALAVIAYRRPLEAETGAVDLVRERNRRPVIHHEVPIKAERTASPIVRRRRVKLDWKPER